MQKKPLLYPSWQALSTKQKQKLIGQATQSQSDRHPNPQADHIFSQLNFIDFIVHQNKKPIKLTTYRQQPKNIQPVAIIIMLHGLNSHLGHGAHISYHFAENGFITVGFDHRGFGRSQGEPGYTESLDRHIEDSLAFVMKMKQLYPKLPFFCLGLSMGGMTSYYLTLKHRHLFEGAIMMAPALKSMFGGFLHGLTKTMAFILPKKTKLMKPVYGKASRNPTITDFVKQDEHYFSERVRLSTIQMLATTMEKTPETFKHYDCPFMIIQGGLDKLVNPDGAFELYYECKTKQQDKQLLFYEKMWHDIWHQIQIIQIIQKVIVWLKKQITTYKYYIHHKQIQQ